MPQANAEGLSADTLNIEGQQRVVFDTDDVPDEPPLPKATPDEPQAPPEPEPTPEPAPKTDEPKAEPIPAGPKADDAGPAQAGTPAATPKETPPEFDAAAFGLNPDEYKHCKTQADALRLMASRQSNLNTLLARQAAELGERRKRDREATPQSPTAPKAPDTPPAPAAAPVPFSPTQAQITAETAQWTDQERAEFEALVAEDPAKAYGALAERVANRLLQAERARVDSALGQLQQRLDAAAAAPRQAQMEQEFADFQRAHLADWPVAEKRVATAARALSIDPNVDDSVALADLHALGELAESDAQGFESVIGLMLRGLPMKDARRFVDLEAADRARKAEDAKRVQEEAKRREDEAKAQADAAARKQSRVALAGKGAAANVDTEKVNFGDID